MSKVVAKRKYVALVKEILPSIQVPTVPQTFSASPRSQQHITNLRHRGNKLYAHANGASSPRMRRVVQHVPSLSYTKIWLQIISLFFMIAIILATFSYFAPMLLAGKLSHLKSSLPFVWLSIGYIFVLVVRPRVSTPLGSSCMNPPSCLFE
jgi:hypothetical protein